MAEVKPRADIMEGRTGVFKIGCLDADGKHGKIYVTINHDEENVIRETFTVRGKTGTCQSAMLEAVSKVASAAMRAGVPASEIAKYLRGIRCQHEIGMGPNKILSCPDAIGIAIQTEQARITGEQKQEEKH